VTRYLKHARFLAGALALIVGLTFVAPPAFAAESTAPAQPLAAAAAAKVAAVPAASLGQAAQTAQQAPPTTPVEARGKPFFKSTKGAIALVLLGGTLGYMAYSMSNDRIKSPAK